MEYVIAWLVGFFFSWEMLGAVVAIVLMWWQVRCARLEDERLMSADDIRKVVQVGTRRRRGF